MAEPVAPSRFGSWVKNNTPTRASFENSRWLRPVAHRVLAPALWRFTRRSVPRGVALGVVTGILAPVAQIPLSAVLALPFRANIPAAALTTFITNPFTTPAIWAAAYWLGRQILRFDQALPGRPIATGMKSASDGGWTGWLLSDFAPSVAIGLLVITIAGAVIGYFLTALIWRVRIARKWRNRHA